MVRHAKQLLRDEAGVSSVEYAILVSLVSLAALAAWQMMGETISNSAGEAATAVANAGD